MAELATRPPFYHSDSDDSTSKSQWQTKRRLVEYSSSSTVRKKKSASLVCLSAHVRPSSIEQQPRHHCVISCYRKRNPLLPSPMKKIIVVVVLVVARSRLRNRVTLRRTLCNEKMQRSTESRRYIAYNIFYAFNLCLFLFFSPRYHDFARIVASLCGHRSHSSRVTLPRRRVATNEPVRVHLFPFDFVRLWPRASIFNIEREISCTLDLIEKKRKRIRFFFQSSSIQVDALRGDNWQASPWAAFE